LSNTVITTGEQFIELSQMFSIRLRVRYESTHTWRLCIHHSTCS